MSAATHSGLTFHCVADVESIISARSLTGLGWDIRFLGSQGTGELYVPGIRGCIPLPRGPKGEYLLMLVQDPRMPRGVFSIQGNDPSLRDLRTFRFLVDSGADCNILAPALGAAMLETTSVSPVTIHGVCGRATSQGTGLLRLGFWQDGGPIPSTGTGQGAAAFDLGALGPNRRVWRAPRVSFPAD